MQLHYNVLLLEKKSWTKNFRFNRDYSATGEPFDGVAPVGPVNGYGVSWFPRVYSVYIDLMV